MAHVMLVPSTDCPAACIYCFGPHTGGPKMGMDVVDHVCTWLHTFPAQEPITITFHGGEPLAAGYPFLRDALARLHAVRPGIEFGIQSNLWLLSEKILDLFAQYRVHIGTSLDGPEDINDRQRGIGYFGRTMSQLDRVRRQGARVGVVATLTTWSAPRWREILSFFIKEKLDVSLHAALPGYREGIQEWALSPRTFSTVMGEIFQEWLSVDFPIRVQPFESMVGGMLRGSPATCMFGDCLGSFFAIDPLGRMFPCQRFVGDSRYCLGSVDKVAMGDWQASPAWKQLRAIQEDAEAACEGCAFWQDCRGGCPYNKITAGPLCSGQEAGVVCGSDPYCQAYYNLFTMILEQASQDFFSVENMTRLVDSPDGSNPLRIGALRQKLDRSGRG